MRLLSYNIHKGIGGRDRLYRLQRIIDVIEHENPDIICLQEVDRNVQRSRFHNQPRLLKNHFLPASHLYQPNVQLKTGGYGNLIFSRWPFKTQHQVSITFKKKKRRGAQLVVIDALEGPVHIVHWHLGLAEFERHWQVNHVFGHPLFRESQDLPTIMVGDTNDWRDTLQEGVFTSQGYRQISAPLSRFRSFPAYLPVGALDKAFGNDKIYVSEARVVRTSLSKVASDHLPLVVDFHLDRSRVEEI